MEIIPAEDSGEKVLISLGANLGPAKDSIRSAMDYLINSGILKKAKISSFYETEPLGEKNQPWFVNAVISGYTNYSVYNLIEFCKTIEYFIGRKIRPRWHQREIDIDILIYGATQIDFEHITIPHPRMHERKFVLVPGAEIAGDMIDPSSGKTISELLNICKDTSEVNHLN